MIHETIGTEEWEWAGKPARAIGTVGQQDGSVLVVPVGSVEQHGNHLPVITDTLLVDAVVHGGAKSLRDDIPLLVTPPIWSGFSPHHLSLGGTLSLEFEHLRRTLEDVGRTGLENGFDAVCFVNGHGGNMPLIDALVSTLGQAVEAEVLGMTYFTLATPDVSDLRESETGGMAHGGEYETSLMLYLRPDLVADSMIEKGTRWDEHYNWAGGDLLDSGSLSVYREFEEYSETGDIGAPELASVDKGERIYEAVTEELSALFTAIHEHNR
jgi:creatinine amidohydrolase